MRFPAEGLDTAKRDIARIFKEERPTLTCPRYSPFPKRLLFKTMRKNTRDLRQSGFCSHWEHKLSRKMWEFEPIYCHNTITLSKVLHLLKQPAMSHTTMSKEVEKSRTLALNHEIFLSFHNYRKIGTAAARVNTCREFREKLKHPSTYRWMQMVSFKHMFLWTN